MNARWRLPARNAGGKPHLTVDEIARAIEGGLGAADGRLLAHLRSCDKCFDVYQDSAISLGLWMEEAPVCRHQGLAEEMNRLVPGGGSPANVIRREGSETRGPGWRYLWRAGIATAALAAVIIAVVWFGDARKRDSSVAPFAILPIRAAVETVSMWGPMILPGGENAVGNAADVFRSGYVETSAEIEASLSALFEAYQGRAASAEIAYWLAAGYLTTGQVNVARDVVNDAQQRLPGDPRIQSAAGIIAHIDGDFERAESIFRRLLERDPADAVTRINLAVVLTERNEFEEAELILSDVLARQAGTPLAERAKSIIDRSSQR